MVVVLGATTEYPGPK